MAQKRMFSREITDSDSFLDLSLAAQCLYFHACLSADDEGFISAGKRIARSIGATEKELAELADSGFLILFPDSGVYVAAHFMVNNTLKSDRFHPTVYQAERKQLELNENKVYVLRNQNGTITEPDRKQSGIENSIDKSSLEKDRKEKISKDDNRIEEGSPEGGNLLSDDPETVKTFVVMAQMDGIGREAAAAVQEHGLNVAHAAFTKWREHGKIIGRYNDELKEILKGE